MATASHTLLNHVPADYQVACGARLNDTNTNKSAGDNVNGKGSGGNSKSYTLKRLARDSENDPEVAEVYKLVARG